MNVKSDGSCGATFKCKDALKPVYEKKQYTISGKLFSSRTLFELAHILQKQVT